MAVNSGFCQFRIFSNGFKNGWISRCSPVFLLYLVYTQYRMRIGIVKLKTKFSFASSLAFHYI